MTSTPGVDAPITVLVVDDDPTMRQLMTSVLVKGGCEVVEVEDGGTALALLRARPLPHVVVTDLMMPVMSGVELIRELRAHPSTAELPIVVVSGEANSEVGAEVKSLANAMMDKVSILTSLMSTVASLTS
jgi:CheY-like chemotaxis protein